MHCTDKSLTRTFFLSVAVFLACIMPGHAQPYRDMTADDLTGSWRVVVDGIDVEVAIWPSTNESAPYFAVLTYTPEYNCLRFGTAAINKFSHKRYGHTEHYGALFSEAGPVFYPDWRGGTSTDGDCMVQTDRFRKSGVVGFQGWMQISPEGVISSETMRIGHQNPFDRSSNYFTSDEDISLTLEPRAISPEMRRWLDRVESGEFDSISLDVFPLAQHRPF